MVLRQRPFHLVNLAALFGLKSVAQIGLDDRGIGSDVLGAALRDDLAEMEHADLGAKAGHQLQVVLDDDHAQVALSLDLPQSPQQHGHIVGSQAGCGLIEQHHGGVGHHGPSHLHQFL